LLDLRPEINRDEAQMYHSEAIEALANGKLRSAFRSFYHGLLLFRYISISKGVQSVKQWHAAR
jgi:hypothetical protein